MKKIYINLLLGLLTVMSSCDDKLDIVPRGMSTLYTVEDLAAILNQQWRIYDDNQYYDIIAGQTFPKWKSMGDVYNVKNSFNYAYVFGDESVDRIGLTESDQRYTNLYKYIQYLNIVISKMPDAEGDESLKAGYIAQARVLRAYLHFLAVNFYAAQYDDDTAASTGGIAYVDNTNSGEEKTKLSVAEVYSRILDDCSDQVLAQLPAKTTDDPCRFEADFGYGVRARVLFQMKHYEDAYAYAEKALAVNPNISDRSTIQSMRTWTSEFDDSNNYLFIKSTNVINNSEMTGRVLTPELVALYEDGDYVRYYSQEDDWIPFEEHQYGAPGSLMYYGTASRINTYGLCAEQMYYVSGESLIHMGRIDDGLEKIDMVRRKRIHTDYYTPFKGRVSTQKDAIQLLRRAKRIEFICCYETFFDCKRLNSEPEYAADVTRDCGEYGTSTIRPGSSLWIFPFPMDATNYNSSLTQNI